MIHFGPMLRRAAAILLACYRVLTKCPVLWERGSRRDAPGVRAIPPCFSQVFGLSAPVFELSRATVQRLPPSWFLDVVGARPCSPPQPLFFSRQSLLRVYRAGLRSLGPILPIIFGVWKCYYFGRAPFTAPERRAKRAASSAAGHAPTVAVVACRRQRVRIRMDVLLRPVVLILAVSYHVSGRAYNSAPPTAAHRTLPGKESMYN
ncbi:hypothetical protein NDU88_004792 [Pleurodeles waltl]|uniref:Secreted protein n=1 Tax=Pleurodeles waltl TaxID=8319 RepID=A0AAV7PGS7_PLEWA|nr:hypothetical protein NDU88_004792 [Pleurodeles waltl]